MAAPPPFPVSIGPFKTLNCSVATAINAFYRQQQFPRPQLDNPEPSLAGLDPSVCGLPPGAILYCQLSPLHKITLDDEMKVAASIPMEAKFFAWAYPVVDDGTVVHGHSAEHMFLKYGGYVYFNRACEAVGTNSIAPAPVGSSGLVFGRAQDLPSNIEDILTRQGRFQEITLAPLTAAGATHFAWIRPDEFSEFIASTDGCFAYKFGHEMARYFPVVSQPLFTADLLEEQLDGNEAWVVVRPHHPTVERIVVFDKTTSFNENMKVARLGDLVLASDENVVAHRSGMEGPISYHAWKESHEQGTLANPWILSVINRRHRRHGG